MLTKKRLRSQKTCNSNRYKYLHIFLIISNIFMFYNSYVVVNILNICYSLVIFSSSVFKAAHRFSFPWRGWRRQLCPWAEGRCICALDSTGPSLLQSRRSAWAKDIWKNITILHTHTHTLGLLDSFLLVCSICFFPPNQSNKNNV